MPPPVANYVDAVQVGNLLFLSGNTPDAQWKFKGKVGKDMTVQEGYDTARQVGLIMLAKVRNALGSLDRVKRVVVAIGPGKNDDSKFHAVAAPCCFAGTPILAQGGGNYFSP